MSLSVTNGNPIIEESLSASKRVNLGNTNVSVTRLGVGCSPLGGSLGRAMSDSAVTVTISAAIKNGLGYFDTAPHYGQGQSESRLGEELQKFDRKSYVISTKVGVTLVPGRPGLERGGLDFASSEPFESKLEFTREAVERSFEQSLKRLKLDRIDVVLIHDPDEGVTLLDPKADPYSKSHFIEAMDNVYPFLAEMRSAGVVGAIGVGINQWQMLRDFARAGDFDCFLLARQFTLICHDGVVTELLPLCKQKNISLILGGTFHSGILVTGSRPADGTRPFMDIGAAPPEIVERVSQIEEVCAAHKVPLPAAALQFPMGSQRVASVIPGVRSESELVQNINWFQHQITKEFWNDLKSSRLIHPSAPIRGE